MTKTKRCFIAINLPEQLKKEIFERLSKKIPARDCNVVGQENLHITLLFLGYLAEDAIKETQEKIATVKKFNAFEAELNGTGKFGNRVFWVSVKSGAEEIKKIAAELQGLLGTRDEKFSAHLTIARNKLLSVKETTGLLEKLQKENFSARFKVETIDLMESILLPNGPKYKKLFSASLSA